ncbi:hypothetical protein [Achromobacter dolens]|uniref:hypothetical protein n=1 Tax=Achromobacter dolens TaxID=1287738 RepID=UPI00300CCC86
MSFENRCIAFLDVLGFKELIRDAEVNRQRYDEFTKLITVVDSHVRWDNETTSPEVPEEAKPKYLFISDSIIISAPLSFNGYDGLAIVTMKAIQIAQKMLEIGFLVRGCINIGNVWHETRNIFGTGYVDAYLGEQKAKHPRIILTEAASVHLLESEHRGSPLRDMELWIRREEEIIAHTLCPSYARIPPIPEGSFKVYRVNITSELEKLHSRGVRDKWQWIANYFNDVIGQNNLNVQKIDLSLHAPAGCL